MRREGSKKCLEKKRGQTVYETGGGGKVLIRLQETISKGRESKCEDPKKRRGEEERRERTRRRFGGGRAVSGDIVLTLRVNRGEKRETRGTASTVTKD